MRQPNAYLPGSNQHQAGALTEFEELVVLNDDQPVGVALADEALAAGHTPEGLRGQVVYVDFQKNVAYPADLGPHEDLILHAVLEVNFHLSGLGSYPSREARTAAKGVLQQALASTHLADHLSACLRTRRGDRALTVASEVIEDSVPGAATAAQSRQVLLRALEAFCEELQRHPQAALLHTPIHEPECLFNEELSQASPR
ncbi:hypothetical protein JTL52_18120 [Pseudomonas aeruginosa]|nr:hypothetical protein [Pseudomonas aeruginosa]